MARVTIEDCLKYVDNRFELVLLASQRARDLLAGAEATVDSNEREIVTSLREIEQGKLDIDNLRVNLVRGIRIDRGVHEVVKESVGDMPDLDELFASLDQSSGVESISGDIFASSIEPSNQDKED